MIAYKGFDKGLKCRNMQYEIDKTYETDDAKCCEYGFHCCRNPLDVLNYYDLCDSEFARVETLGKIDKLINNSTKIATTKIKISAKLSLSAFIKASINFLLEKCGQNNNTAASGDFAQLAVSGDFAQLAASGDFAQLAASGNFTKLAASGNFTKLAASGNFTKLAASGNSAKLAASDNSAQLAASGNSTQLAASGDFAQLAASGYFAQLAASGNSAKLAASGNYTKLVINGEDSVGAAIGIDNTIKGKKGNWITLAEWTIDKTKNRYVPVCVKSVQIDGEKIKEDTYYTLKGGEFVIKQTTIS